jgi:hypothetical protein
VHLFGPGRGAAEAEQARTNGDELTICDSHPWKTHWSYKLTIKCVVVNQRKRITS